MTEFLQSNVESDVVNLRLAQQADHFMTNTCKDRKVSSSGAGVILFTAEFDPTLLMKAVAHHHKGRFAVAEARGSNDRLAKHFQLGRRELPVVIAVCGGNQMAYEIHEGEQSYAGINTFLNKFKIRAYCKNLIETTASESKKKTSDIFKLTAAQLKKKKMAEVIDIINFLSVDTSGLVEKKDYVEAIEKAIAEQKKNKRSSRSEL